MTTIASLQAFSIPLPTPILSLKDVFILGTPMIDFKYLNNIMAYLPTIFFVTAKDLYTVSSIDILNIWG